MGALPSWRVDQRSAPDPDMPPQRASTGNPEYARTIAGAHSHWRSAGTVPPSSSRDCSTRFARRALLTSSASAGAAGRFPSVLSGARLQPGTPRRRQMRALRHAERLPGERGLVLPDHEQRDRALGDDDLRVHTEWSMLETPLGSDADQQQVVAARTLFDHRPP